MTVDLRIPDAGLVWVRRGMSYVAVPDPDAGTTCHGPTCKRPRTPGNRYCSDACRAADTHPVIHTCWRCCAPYDGRGRYCSDACEAAVEAQRNRHRDWSVYDRPERPAPQNYGTCPTCGSTQGQKCRSAKGNTIGRDHKDRPTP